MEKNEKVKRAATNPCTTMKNCPTKVMSSCAQRECEEDRTKLKLHCDKTDNGLQQ